MSNFSPVSAVSSSPTNGVSPPAPIVAPTIPTIAKDIKPQINKPATKPRKRVNTAEKRSQHNAIERARRETLNGKFLSLARLLPSLAASRRPSKSAIVNGSIAHLTHQRNQRLLAAKMLKQMSAERDELLNEVNEWRKMSGYAPKEISNKWTNEMEEISAVEKETFGSFASMEGDDNDEDDTPQSESFDTISGGSNGTYASVNGLITPRSSADLDLSLAQSLYNGNAVEQRTMAASASVPATATVNGVNWSTEFAFNLGQGQGQTLGASLTGSLIEAQAQGSSPTQVVVTPSSEPNMYTHTPSPGSSHSIASEPASIANAAVGATNAPNGWTAQQFSLLQQQALQHNIQLRAHQQAQQRQAQRSQSQSQQPFNPIHGNSFNAMFGQIGEGQSNALLGNLQQSQEQTDRFTHQMLASMFPQGSASGQPVLPNLQPSLEDLQNAVRTGMGMGFNMVGGWNNAAALAFSQGHGQTQSPSAVEGF
ncbi:hypothetical protein I316_02177 [Kwoniella heveanensis BCC8398]|uniref:BHLH domain-containing protein n=1 Tax=Kwoniella heveanensis BCC8398 TaxID=1296120 RepID=A0A1B9GZ61_9TREE|nr:hypothetical protein I316_02177 [Kwoniella heveanensis BCC8398]